MKKHLQLIERNKADNGLRLANYVIDYIIVYLLFFIFAFLATFISEIFGFEGLREIVDSLSTMDRITDALVTSSVYFLYSFSMEYFTNGRTVGKFVTGTKAISIDAQLPTIKQFFIRNISRFVPFDGLSFFGTNGWHDSWSDTRVIKISKYENAVRMENDLENIGKQEN